MKKLIEGKTSIRHVFTVYDAIFRNSSRVGRYSTNHIMIIVWEIIMTFDNIAINALKTMAAVSILDNIQ